MNRYLLDTNIIVFYLFGERDNFSNETIRILSDYESQLYTSSIAIGELIQLFRLKKVQSRRFKTAKDLVKAIEDDFFITILPFTKQHTKTLSGLQITDSHSDPFDHCIISHALTEKLSLISSDTRFKNYIEQGLLFVFNKR